MVHGNSSEVSTRMTSAWPPDLESVSKEQVFGARLKVKACKRAEQDRWYDFIGEWVIFCSTFMHCFYVAQKIRDLLPRYILISICHM